MSKKTYHRLINEILSREKTSRHTKNETDATVDVKRLILESIHQGRFLPDSSLEVPEKVLRSTLKQSGWLSHHFENARADGEASKSERLIRVNLKKKIREINKKIQKYYHLPEQAEFCLYHTHDHESPGKYYLFFIRNRSAIRLLLNNSGNGQANRAHLAMALMLDSSRSESDEKIARRIAPQAVEESLALKRGSGAPARVWI